jgi:putative tryptophan/tyrosine transport system substrate-binding protein
MCDAHHNAFVRRDVRRNASRLFRARPRRNGTSAVGPLLEATRTVPIVFVQVSDPVGAGYVASLARPGGNATGFVLYEYGMSGKWLELLKQIAPGVKRAVVLRDATQPTGIAQLAAMQAVAPSLGVELSRVGVRDPDEIERHITAFARAANGGLVVTSGARTIRQRDQILALAARHRLPGVYSERIFVAGGGLISYGTDTTDQCDPGKCAGTASPRLCPQAYGRLVAKPLSIRNGPASFLRWLRRMRTSRDGHLPDCVSE